MLLAHLDSENGYEQTLQQHLNQVGEEMKKELETVSFSDSVVKKEVFEKTGQFHDLGKITTWFQEYLRGKGVSDRRKNHALISAFLYAQQRMAEGDGAFPFLECAAITYHHGNLSADLLSDKAQIELLEEQYENCRAQAAGNEFEQLIQESFDTARFASLWRRAKKKGIKEKNPEYYFALQLLFSKLISADKRDSANLLTVDNPPAEGDVDNYLKKKTAGNGADVNSDRERIRNQVLKSVEDLTEEEIKTARIFTLTAPTGTGKTLTSVSAALKLADKIEVAEGVRPHLITAVPFLNILEQTVDDYQGIFGSVLVHSSAVTGNNTEGITSISNRNLIVNSWQAPVVLTTFVQFFESILSGQNERLLKVNRLCNAIVILDEVQALDAERYPLYAVVIDMLARHYGTRFILMTATQPRLFDCAAFYQYTPQSCRELLPNYKMYFEKLKRTELRPVFDAVDDFASLSDFILANGLAEKNVLIVVNKIADSIELYKLLKEQDYDVLYLSTNLTRRDRKSVIRKAHEKLKNPDEPFIMVSTQTIEAGVDLDFDVAFRDLAPMESIIQTAGRVNRSGNKGTYCPVYIFNSGSAKQIYSVMAINAATELLTGNIPESEYQKLTEQYYTKLLCADSVAFDTRIYQDGILQLDYEVISEFKMIRDDNRYSILFLQDEEAEELAERFCQLVLSREKSFEKNAEIKQVINELGKYTVDVFAEKIKKNMPISFGDYSKSICGVRIELEYFVVTGDDLSRYYDETGYIAEEPGIFMF